MKRRILHDAEGDLQNKRVRKSALPVRVGETVVEIPVELWLRYALPCVEPGIGRYILSDRYHQLRQVVGTTLWRHRDAFGGYHGGKLGLGRVEQLQERLVGSRPHCAPPQCGVCLSMQTAAAVFEDAALFSVIKQALRTATLPLSDKQVGLPPRVYCSDRDIELKLTTEIPYSHDGYRGTLTAADREVISAAEPNRDHWVVRRMRQVQLVLAEERRRRWAVQRATLLPQLPTVIIHMIVDYVHARPPSPIDDLKEEIAKAAGLTAYPSLVQLIFQYDGSLWYDMLTAGEKKAIRDAAEQLSLAHYIEHRLIRSDPYVGSQPPQIGGECMLLEFFLGTNVGELGQEQMQLHGRPTTVFALNCWHLWQYATIAVHDCE